MDPSQTQALPKPGSYGGTDMKMTHSAPPGGTLTDKSNPGDHLTH